MAIRILLAEDHAALRAALRALLEAERDLEVVDEAGSAGEMLRLVDEVRPDVIVLDIGLPGLHGFEGTHELRQILPETQILVLMDEEDPSLTRDALVAGAADCVSSQAAESTLVTAIRAVSAAHLYIQPGVLRELLADRRMHSAWFEERTAGLTPCEVDVLRLIAHGRTNRQVAEELGLSVQMVESHRANIMAKLGLHSRVELVRYAATRQLARMPN